MRRFFLGKEAFHGNTALVTGEAFRHMARVLRLKPGTPVILADGEGNEYSGLIKLIEKDRLLVDIEDSRPAPAGEGPRITLCQGVPKGDKMEHILQKCTELGVSAFVPFLSRRTVVRLSPDQYQARLNRWQRVVLEAARQSQCPLVPPVSAISPFAEMVANARQEVKLLLWEEETANRLKTTLADLPQPASIALVVGPEGGLSPEEAQLATSHGFIPVSLGKRILRTETAGPTVAAILQFYWGDLGE